MDCLQWFQREGLKMEGHIMIRSRIEVVQDFKNDHCLDWAQRIFARRFVIKLS